MRWTLGKLAIKVTQSRSLYTKEALLTGASFIDLQLLVFILPLFRRVLSGSERHH